MSAKTIGGMSKTKFVASSKTPTVGKKYRKSIILDDEDTEDDDWIEDLREYLKNRLQKQLDEDVTLDQRRKDLLKSVVQGYRNQLGRNRFDKHTRGAAWEAVLDTYRKHLRDNQVFDPDDDEIEQPHQPVQ